MTDATTTAAAIGEIVRASDAAPGDLLGSICGVVSRAFELERVVILRYHERIAELETAAVAGCSRDDLPGRLPIAEAPLLRRALESLQLVHVADVRAGGLLPEDLVERCGITAAVCVPLASSGRCLGFLAGDRGGASFQLDEGGVAALTTIGTLTATLLENQLVAEEMQRLDSMKSEFIAIASHELRTPLTSVYGISMTLDERGDDLTQSERVQLRRALREQADRLMNLVEQLLDLSRFDVAAVGVSPTPVALEPRLAHLVALAGAEEAVTLEVDRSLVARVDPIALDRIVSNLLSNALRYGSPPVTVSAASDGSQLLLHVEDRGAGVADGFVPRLFDRFSRGETSADRVTGSGLGLAIARAYARAHGGDLSYEHARPHGARFVLYLPDATHADVVAPAAPAPRAAGWARATSGLRFAPVVVVVAPPEAARTFRDLLDDYFAVLIGSDRIEIEPIDDVRRGTVIYRVVQAATTVAAQFPDADMFFIAEDGNRWRLPPPPI